MSILVTGVTGFVGGYVLKELKKKYPANEILALSSHPVEGIQTIPSKNYSFDSEYLIHNGCMEVDTLIHVGAWTPKSGKEANLLDKAISNITGTQRLIASKLPSLKKIVFCSTLDVYHNTNETITEATPVGPETMYGWSKLYCEKMVEVFAKENNIVCQVLRLGHVFGEGEEKYRKVMPVMIENAIKGNDLMIHGNGEAIRTFIYIEDVAKAIVNALTLKSSRVINVVGNEAVTIHRLAELIQKNCGREIHIHHIPTDTADRNYLFDNTQLMTLLLDSLTPFEAGLRSEMDYMKRRVEQ